MMKNTVHNFVRSTKQRPLLYLLVLSLAVRIAYLLLYPSLWWDSHIYIGMGKYIFSGGELGVWESFRPLLHPSLLGFFWKLHLPPILLGKILDLIFSLLGIYLVYLIGKKVFNQNVALLSALIFSLSPIFIKFTGIVLTEPLAMVWGLLGVYIFITKESPLNLFLSGIFLSLSFLTKFPQGILFAAALFVLLLRKERIFLKIKKILLTTLGFIIPLLPYGVFNYFRYPNQFEPFISGSWIVTTFTWLYGSGIGYYIVNFFLVNPFYLFFFPTLYFFFKERQWKNPRLTLLVLIPTLIIIYFLYVPRKEPRYLVLAVPFLSLIISPTLIKARLWIKNFPYRPATLKIIFNLSIALPLALVLLFSGVVVYFKWLFLALIVLFLIVVVIAIVSYKKLRNTTPTLIKKYIIMALIIVFFSIPFIFSGVFTYFKQPVSLHQEYLNYLEKNNISGTILSSHPALLSYLDTKVILFNGLQYTDAIYQREQGKYQVIIVSDCDFPCNSQNQNCLNKKQQFLQKIKKENTQTFHRKTFDPIIKQRCEHFIYKTKK